MAIYHLSVKPISRSAGRSATAAAAYRAGCEIVDQRTGEIHDYTRKRGVKSADIVLPDGAPTWATNRAKLWNAAELAEKRKDACVAREFEVALPFELSPAERRQLALDFAKDMANREGCAVDVAIHAPTKKGDNRNHHAHILRTTRRVEANGLGAKLDTEQANRKRKDDIEAVRARWAELTNVHLERAGHAARVDQRTLEEQGQSRLPTQHLGPFVAALEARGIKTDLGNLNRARAEKNKSIEADAIELKSLRVVEARAESLKNELFKLRREIDKKPKNWTTPLLQITQAAFEKATAAFEKLVSWRALEKKIANWRKEHPTRAALRVGDSELVKLENQKAELGEIDQQAEDKFKDAELTLRAAEVLAHEEWIKKNDKDKLEVRKLARELSEINDFDYGHDEPEGKSENAATDKSQVQNHTKTKKPNLEWRPLKQARPGPRFGVGPASNIPSNDFNPNP